MLERIPIEPKMAVIFGAIGLIIAAILVGFALVRRDVRKVDPNDALRDP